MSAPVVVVIVRFDDRTDFEAYENEVVEKIVQRQGEPAHVVWDLRELTRVPWRLIPRQVEFLRRHQDHLWDRIERSTVVVGRASTERYLRGLFALYTPRRPVEIATEMPADLGR